MIIKYFFYAAHIHLTNARRLIGFFLSFLWYRVHSVDRPRFRFHKSVITTRKKNGFVFFPFKSILCVNFSSFTFYHYKHTYTPCVMNQGKESERKKVIMLMYANVWINKCELNSNVCVCVIILNPVYNFHLCLWNFLFIWCNGMCWLLAAYVSIAKFLFIWIKCSSIETHLNCVYSHRI